MLTLKNSPQQISEGNIGLSRDIYANGFDDKVVQKYLMFMVNVSVFFGAGRKVAETDLKDVILFEMELANVSSLKSLR